jgi:hypothetical protein
VTAVAESSPFVCTFRRFARAALMLLCAALMARPLPAQLLDGLGSAGRVVVSRNEVRVYFPPLPTVPARTSRRRRKMAASCCSIETRQRSDSPSGCTRPPSCYC